MCVEFCCLFDGTEHYEEGWVIISYNGELVPDYRSSRYRGKPCSSNHKFYDTKAEAVAVAEGIRSGCATCFFSPYKGEAEKVKELREFYEKLQ